MKFRSIAKMDVTKWMKLCWNKTYPFARVGNYVHIHTDKAPMDLQKERETTFRAETFFDPECPCCQPFLKEGALIIYGQDPSGNPVAIRPAEGEAAEIVILRRPSSALADTPIADMASA